MEFSDTQIERYARHIILKEIGGAGQIKLLESRVLIIGAGGLGSPLLLYLAAAGVGTIGIVDDDKVSLSNLQRQIVHTTDKLGASKTQSALSMISRINPDVTLVPHDFRLTEHNILSLINEYDVIADGSDNFETRFLVNDACYFCKKTLVSGALLGFDGQLSTYKAHLGVDHPCYRCLFDEPETSVGVSCAEAGVLGALAGAIGSFQAIEVVKELLGLGESLSGTLLIVDALGTTFRKVKVKRDAACRLCGDNPDITDLSR